MKSGLSEINELEGVWGSMLCSNQGELIESAPPPDLNSSTLENIGRHAVEMLSRAGLSISGLLEIVSHYRDRRLLIMDLERALLIVFCTPGVDISLLRMTTNLVINRWEEDADVQEQFEKAFVERL